MTEQRHVLIVEDSPTQAERLRSLIAASDLQIAVVSSAEAALEHIRRQRPDLVLLDYHLPGMNGNEFCREIRMNVNTRAIPVLMLTVEGSDAAQMQSLNSGADDYITKSADPDVLRVRIRSLLRRADSPSSILDEDSRLFSRARVLLVDDSPSFLYLLQREFQSEHYIVETAAGPLQALERMKSETFDCVLVDFEMPGMDGAEVCRYIRQSRTPSEPELVLIMLTSHEDKQHMALGFEAGADDYITKSVDLAVMKARVRALLRRKFLVEENRRILNELKEKELAALRAQAEREAAELRAMMSDQLQAANRKLDAANRELEQFSYAAAHDLQEPLRMVINYSQLLQSRYGASMDATANQFLAFCVEGGQRMQQLIGDLLAYARSTSAGDQQATQVSLESLVHKALGNLRAAVEESGAVIQCDPLPTLWVEEIRMQQVFQNLIGNALKYRRPTVPPRIHVSARRDGAEWVIAIADNGQGIAPEYRGIVFDAFRRLGGRTQSGTGLGLSICKRTVEHHGGRIWVESEPGAGSTFYFTLPVGAGQPLTKPSTSGA